MAGEKSCNTTYSAIILFLFSHSMCGYKTAHKNITLKAVLHQARHISWKDCPLLWITWLKINPQDSQRANRQRWLKQTEQHYVTEHLSVHKSTKKTPVTLVVIRKSVLIDTKVPLKLLWCVHSFTVFIVNDWNGRDLLDHLASFVVSSFWLLWDKLYSTVLLRMRDRIVTVCSFY